ncbi:MULTISPECIES: MaoC family dehydratase [Paenarthrobacter]|jgi:acyl dehydratase|uniref:MaoC family dehydratase n=1 Tax=Paenarthrobacter TaxID=1742992 RepID=UPI00140A9DF3|nr:MULTISPECIES: MaoC family dehydratase [Paenarthrobacter]MCX8453174.1 MaoC family dehydratase [Paenarthrobacter ureafaciens]MCY0972755.1 MaoC family dehydratase [Paenarthrobacter ureafaciens]QOT16174.1 MaoC family dehydratase [Paenarthrobacter sp. YJN-5]QQQ61545.1 MaoC family dehydratase [Paenarthrobacter ureafaciens]UOD80284.1 MaoC family dehydratase [Paenarthrobacter ureafaciens]
MSPVFADLAVGQEIGNRTIEVTRQDLVKYAGASGDFNPIHWNEAFATSVELPGVIAHGMFTMGAAVQLVSDWAGDPAAVVDYQTRFTKPVLVTDTTGTDEPGAVIEVTGVVGALDAEAGTARIDLTVVAAGQKVLMKSQAVVKLS